MEHLRTSGDSSRTPEDQGWLTALRSQGFNASGPLAASGLQGKIEAFKIGIGFWGGKGG